MTRLVETVNSLGLDTQEDVDTKDSLIPSLIHCTELGGNPLSSSHHQPQKKVLERIKIQAAYEGQ